MCVFTYYNIKVCITFAASLSSFAREIKKEKKLFEKSSIQKMDSVRQLLY